MANRKNKTTIVTKVKTPDRMTQKTDLHQKFDQLIGIITAFQADSKVFQTETNDELGRMESGMSKMEQELSEMKKEITQIKKIEQTIKQMKVMVKENTDHLVEMEEKLDSVQNQLDNQSNQMGLLELKLKEKMLRIRGITETKDESLPEKLALLLAKIWNIPERDTPREYEAIYRANARGLEEDKRITRDILINFVRKDRRDAILRYHSKNKLEYEGNPLILFKEIPTSIRKKQDYNPSAELLRKNNIVYRWAQVERISFCYRGKRVSTNTPLRVQNFLMKYKNELIFVKGGNWGQIQIDREQGSATFTSQRAIWTHFPRPRRSTEPKRRLSTELSPLVGYMDADWGEDKLDYKSKSGNVFFYGDNLISWMSQKWSVVARSTTEFECISACSAYKEMEWIVCLLKDFGIDEPMPITLLEDNQVCIAVMKSESIKKRNKYIVIIRT
ncbi:uncharacterized protein LOC125427773 [Sphaerodactylus townsendi]|uniref:uncharacterized protein LOC125427773 n=1 Tax=Sphaerodactylus townsendi TaxID=933632 RepID=UPI00202705A6|nr:uncharacterized protein LOC125427773 [Sphaerodactylus townsendi]